MEADSATLDRILRDLSCATSGSEVEGSRLTDLCPSDRQVVACLVRQLICHVEENFQLERTLADVHQTREVAAEEDRQLRVRISELDAELNHSRQELSELRAAADTNRHHLEQHLCSLTKEVAQAHAIRAMVDERLAEACAENDGLKSRSRKALSTCADLETRFIQAQSENEKLKATLTEAQSKIAAQEPLLMNAQAENDELKSQSKQAQSTCADLETRLTQAQSENEELKTTLTEVQSNIAAQEPRLRQAQAENDELKAWMKQVEVNRDEIQTLAVQGEAERKELKTRLIQARTDIADLKSRLAQAQLESSDRKTRLTQAHFELSDLKTQMAQIDAQRSEMETLLTHTRSHSCITEARLMKAETEGGDFKSRFINVQAQNTDLKTKLSNAQARCSELDAQLGAALAASRCVEERQEVERQRHADVMKAVLARHARDEQDLHTRIERVTAAHSALVKHLETARSEARDAQTASRSLAAEKKQLEVRLRDTEVERCGVYERNREIEVRHQEALTSLRTKLKQHQGERETMTERMEQLHHEAQQCQMEAQHRVNLLVDEIERLSQQNKALGCALEAANREPARLQNKHKAKLEEGRQQLEQLAAQNRELNSALGDATNEQTELQQRFLSWRDEAERRLALHVDQVRKLREAKNELEVEVERGGQRLHCLEEVLGLLLKENLLIYAEKRELLSRALLFQEKFHAASEELLRVGAEGDFVQCGDEQR